MRDNIPTNGGYPGGKAGSGIPQTIINQIPPHDVYGEAFLGSGTILFNKRPAPVANFGIEIDPDQVARLEAQGAGHIVVHGDALEVIPQWADRWPSERVFTYWDPPYLRHTRSHQADKIYRHEFDTPEQHARLLELITHLPANWMVAISGYWSEQYDQALRSWRRIDFEAWNRAGRPATESLWMNYPEPWELHDYRFVGRNYRERERIKKKAERWLRMLDEMQPQERHAIMHRIEQRRQEAR